MRTVPATGSLGGRKSSIFHASPKGSPLAPFLLASSFVDINLLKGRVAEAFVENVFRRAGYKVSRLGRESHVQQLLKSGKSEFLPDFLVWKPVTRSSDGSSLHRLLSIEVKYRAHVSDFLRRYGAELLSHVGEQWPELYVVIVTDQPEPGRSYFQVLDLCRPALASELATTDLHMVSGLDIFETTCREYEELVRQVFGHLAAQGLETSPARKPLAKILAPEGLFLPDSLSGFGF